MKQHASYYFERLTDENFLHFYELYKQVFRKNDSLNTLKKKYDTAYIIESFWVYLAFDAATGKAVASFGVIPWLFNYQNEAVLAAQSADTMIASDHRGKGLFAILHQKVAELLRENDFKFIFGFPNQNSYPIYKNRLNWKFYGKLNIYSISTNLKIPVRKVFYKLPWLKPFHDAFVGRVFRNFETGMIEKLLENKQSTGTLKNTDFYDYKMSKEHKLIRLGNSYFFIKISNRMLVGEMKLENEAAFKMHVQTLCHLASKTGVTSIDFMCSEGTAMDTLLSAHFRAVASLPAGFFELRESRIDYKNFRFTLIDLDTF